jgi:cation:H+ antiporter
MEEIALWGIAFVVSLTTLITAARFFTNAAEVVGLVLGLSPFAVGVVIVSVGTSLPELIASVVAVSKEVSEVVSGNVIGASISNLFFVLALSAIFARKRIELGDQYILIDLNYLLGAAFLLSLMMLDGKITLAEGVLGLSAYIAYTLYLLRESNSKPDILLSESVKESARSGKGHWKDVAVLVISGIFIYLGANYTIEAIEHIADALQISKAIISVTVLSIGTTLPEAVVSATAAWQGKGEIAVGNILGSCIFNSLAITGIASLVGVIVVPTEILKLPLPVYGVGSLLFYLLTLDKKISRWEGILFLIIYALFILKVAAL